jgi:hypothetical protein
LCSGVPDSELRKATLADPIEELYRVSEDLLALLDRERELSLRNQVEDQFRKALTLSAASMFESVIKGLIEEFCRSATRGLQELVSVVRIGILDRHYHTLFDWDKTNANKFFGLFGEPFKAAANDDVRQDAALEDGVRAFLTVGRLRNELVHGNYATVAFDTTTGDVMTLYSRARVFTTYLENKLASLV